MKKGYQQMLDIVIGKDQQILDIYIIKQDILIYIYMLPIAGQTAGPIELTFFVDTHGWPGSVKG